MNSKKSTSRFTCESLSSSKTSLELSSPCPLRSFFEMDQARHPRYCRYILEEIASIKSGKTNNFTSNVNMHVVRIDPENAVISVNLNANIKRGYIHSCSLPLGYLESASNHLLDAVEDPTRKHDSKPDLVNTINPFYLLTESLGLRIKMDVGAYCNLRFLFACENIDSLRKRLKRLINYMGKDDEECLTKKEFPLVGGENQINLVISQSLFEIVDHNEESICILPVRLVALFLREVYDQIAIND